MNRKHIRKLRVPAHLNPKVKAARPGKVPPLREPKGKKEEDKNGRA